MDMEELLQFTIDLSEGNDYLDVRLENIQNVVINAINTDITTALTSKKTGVGIRVLSGGAWGFCSTQDLSKDGIRKSVKLATKMARIESRKTKQPIQLAEIPISVDQVDIDCKIDFRDLDLEEKVQLVLDWSQEIRKWRREG